MTRRSRTVLPVVAGCLLLTACNPTASSGGSGNAPEAGEWPGETTLYIPTAPGGGFDIAARALRPALADELGEDVVPTNLEGGGGVIAAQQLLTDPEDGTATMITSRSITAFPYTGTPDLDPLVDLAPIGITHEDVSAVTVAEDSPYRTLDDLITAARDEPGEITIGTVGNGGVWHAAGLLMEREAGVEFEYVPYDGGSTAGNALVAGEIDAMTVGAPEARPFVDSGDARMLGVMGEERSELFPDVPTLTEQGLDVVYTVWRGYMVSAEVPEAVQEEMSARLEEAAQDETYQEAMANAGFETTWVGPDGFADLLAEDDELFRELFEGEDFVTTEPERG